MQRVGEWLGGRACIRNDYTNGPVISGPASHFRTMGTIRKAPRISLWRKERTIGPV